MVKDSRRWEAPAALERHRRGSGFCLDGEVTQIAFRPVHDRHGKQRRFEVSVGGGGGRGQRRRRTLRTWQLSLAASCCRWR